MYIVSAALAVISVILFVSAGKKKNLVSDMKGTITSSSAEITDLAKSVGQEIGTGSFSQKVELTGRVKCSQPLVSEMAEKQCVWYKATVHREYEETITEKDSEGRTKTRTQRGSELLTSNERHAEFELEDESGRIAINPAGAKIEGERVVNSFEPGEQNMSVGFGRFSFAIGRPSTGRRTLGYKLEEWAIELDRNIYVLGEARDDSGRLTVAKPGEKGSRYIISTKSKEDIVKAASKSGKTMSTISLVLIIGAIALAALKLMNLI